MIKIIVSNKVYLKPPEELLKLLNTRFQFEIYEHPQQKYPKIVKQIFKISDDVYCLERGTLSFITKWLTENSFEYNIIDRTVSKPTQLPTPKFILRDDQAIICDNINSSAIINAQGGWGKSIAALSIIHSTQQKALIVCTTTAIRQMWMDEVEKWFGFKPGLIGSGEYNIEPDICVGNIQTVQKYYNELSKEFGILVIDEMHHSPASTFTKVVSASHAKIRLGLSGTLKRKDGLEVVFTGLFGDKVFVPEVNNTVKPTIVRVPIPIELSSNAMIPWATRINDLYANQEYGAIVAYMVNILDKYKYSTLITSDRVAFSEALHNAVQNNTSRLFTSNTSIEDRDKALKEVYVGKVNKLFATTSIFSEGISCNPLSALIHTGSTNNESLVYQLIWRIMRIHTGKNSPIVLDICLAGTAGKKHARERKALYLVKGWRVVDLTGLSELDSFLQQEQVYAKKF